MPALIQLKVYIYIRSAHILIESEQFMANNDCVS